MVHKKNIAVLAGGNSSEFHISLKSGETIANELDKERYNVYSIQIKGNDWTLIDDSKDVAIDKNDFSFVVGDQKVKFDLVISAIHGTPGENGLMQGYFEMIGQAYIGSGVLASSLTFSKFYCNTFLNNFDVVNIAKSTLIRKGIEYDADEIIEELKLPCFVKPNVGGSSFGISKVKQKSDLSKAIETAFKESDEVIIEEYIAGDEIQCGIFTTKDNEYILPLVEIVSKNEFFDYQAKYDPNFSEEIIPARISEELTDKCQQITSALYDLLHCQGIVRMDFILKDGAFWFLEANTIPGMTPESIVPQMIRKADMTIKEVMNILIDDAIN